MTPQPYGTVNIGGKTFIERYQEFPLVVSITSNSQQYKTPLTLPGSADFWLKALKRTVLAGTPAVPVTNCPFTFRLGNADGSVWYQSGGTGGTTDQVLDSLLFGTAQFPKVLNPYIYYGASSNININITDVSLNAPYTIYFSFEGSYLLPTS
jgi:hypothetical protein